MNTEKIEVVALIREKICQSEDLEADIRSMKKVTELSTFAIRLGEIYNFISKSKVDFLKISDKFKEHSYYIVKDLNNLLEKVNPQSYRQILLEMKNSSIQADLAKRNVEMAVLEDGDFEVITKNESPVKEVIPEPSVTEEVKTKEEQRPKDDQDENLLFENYEERILTPIKELDALLKNLALSKVQSEELDKYSGIMSKNAELSKKIGFEIIANMHNIFAKALSLISKEAIYPVREVIEGMRASLIVIVAVVRGKDVDIKGYLSKAEDFGKKIQNIN
ncbi:MAG: hypothetical protein ACM3S2_17725 [Ignavibacteriales bacterium]